MLESGYSVFDCQIVKPLSENKIYQSYLVSCPDSKSAKLFLLCPDPLLEKNHQDTYLDHARWLSSQTFPGIGTPLNAGKIDEQLAYLYPSPPGSSLQQSLGDAFTARQTVDLIQKIATSLVPVHNAGFWHGNLSPDNIYIETGLPYLAEFSLSQLIRLDFHSGIDPQYASPEQVRGEASDSATDVYSLGCVFYNLLTGSPPFTGDEPFAIAKQHLQGEFPALPKELNILQPLLDSMTELAAEERIKIDELIIQIGEISKSDELDQIQITAGAQSQIDSTAVENVSLLDETINSSELAARIEARLKEHASEFQQPESFDDQIKADNFDPTTELDKTPLDKNTGFGRFLLILFLGIAIGSGLYFLFGQRGASVSPVTVESKNVEDVVSEADLDHGLQLWRKDDFNGAEAEFKKMIARHQQDPRAYNNLAAFYAAQGNYDQARDYLEQALATDVNYATIYRNLGSVYAEMARGSYGRALQLDRMKETVYLPVFSSQGVVKLQSDADIATKSLVPASSEEIEVSSLSEAGEIISAVETTPVDEPEDTPVVNPVRPEQPAVAVVVEEPESAAQSMVEEKQDAAMTDVTHDSAVKDLSAESEKSFLQRWAQAWSSQDVAAYLSFYGAEFIPPAGKSRVDWEAQRHSRLLAPKEIRVSLEDFQVVPRENSRQQVEVTQNYTSNLLNDRFKKVFDLQMTDKGWKIVRERSLGRVR